MIQRLSHLLQKKGPGCRSTTRLSTKTTTLPRSCNTNTTKRLGRRAQSPSSSGKPKPSIRVPIRLGIVPIPFCNCFRSCSKPFSTECARNTTFPFNTSSIPPGTGAMSFGFRFTPSSRVIPGSARTFQRTWQRVQSRNTKEELPMISMSTSRSCLLWSFWVVSERWSRTCRGRRWCAV